MKYKSQSMVPSLNHRHRKNKIPCFIFMNTRNVFCFTISHIYSCLHLLLQEDFLKISDSFIQLPLPPWNKHTEDLVAKNKTKNIPQTPRPWKVRPWTAQSTPVTWWPLGFWRQLSCFNIPEATFLILPGFLENQMVREPFQVNSMFKLK